MNDPGTMSTARTLTPPGTGFGTERGVISTRSIEERFAASGISFRWVGHAPGSFTGIVTDSRRVRAGALFCAIQGTITDSHKFLPQALAAGATAALVEREQANTPLPQLLVDDTRAATAHLASLEAGDPAAHMEVVAITGTNGKTTTSLISRHLLALRGPSNALGTLGRFDAEGQRHAGERITTPGPLDLMATFTEMRDAGVKSVSMEVSSHALDQERVAAMSFACAVYTNLTREHLDYHADLESYLAAKLKLSSLLGPDGANLVNADDPVWRTADFGSTPIKWFGLSPDADVRATNVALGADGSRWHLVTPEGEVAVHLPLLGEFNVSNALGAAAAALHLGMSPREVAARLSTAPQVPGRMEVLSRQNVLVARDYAHTSDAFTRSIGAIRELVPGRVRVVFGAGGDRDSGKRPEMGRAAAQSADLIIVTRDNPRSEDPARIAAEIVADVPPGQYEIVIDRRDAIARALELSETGDAVLLLGKGHETYQEIRGRRYPFDEAAIVRELTGEPSS